VNGTEAVTQQIFGVKPLYFLQLLGEMALWGVVTEYMLHRHPYTAATAEDAVMDQVQRLQLALGIRLLHKDLPYVTVFVSKFT
jgi:hypothetical protein